MSEEMDMPLYQRKADEAVAAAVSLTKKGLTE